ncbi:hypothetical protein KGM_210017A, partial [Danaus plexippus plexippus]
MIEPNPAQDPPSGARADETSHEFHGRKTCPVVASYNITVAKSKIHNFETVRQEIPQNTEFPNYFQMLYEYGGERIEQMQGHQHPGVQVFDFQNWWSEQVVKEEDEDPGATTSLQEG